MCGWVITINTAKNPLGFSSFFSFSLHFFLFFLALTRKIYSTPPPPYCTWNYHKYKDNSLVSTAGNIISAKKIKEEYYVLRIPYIKSSMGMIF